MDGDDAAEAVEDLAAALDAGAASLVVDEAPAPAAPEPHAPPPRASKLLQEQKAAVEAQLVAIGGKRLRPLPLEPVVSDEGGSHWDYALKEMQWMSNDFRVERKWKLQSARKLVRDTERVLDRKETERKRARMLEQARMRKVAGNIARAVKKTFWDKVDRVVLFKANASYYAEQEKAMGRNLEHLLSQTEKYTKALIDSSAAKADAKAAVPDPELEERELTVALARVMRKYADVSTVAPDAAEAEWSEGVDSLAILTAGDDAATAASTADDDTADEDFELPEGAEPEDDEESLARDEALGGDDGGVDALMADNEVSVDELRARYAHAPPLSDEDSGDADDRPEPADANKSDNAGEQAKAAPRRTPRKALSPSSSEAEDESFVDSMDESDDEESLARDEALLGDDGGGADALKADNEISIEELRARYADAPPASPSSSSPSSSAADERASVKDDGATSEARTVPTPFLLSTSRPLREYQRAGLDWLVSMHDRGLNGILADEMGLGKTIQTIALLAHLAGARGVWGPHLIIVPTSVLLNWELELKTWCPALRVLTYFGSPQERLEKRAGWTKPNAFHVCVTSYQLAVQDAAVFRRKRWYYLILDEAHALKNAKSQRWQTLMLLNTKRRLLLTGTPLQNSLMELWSLMHFLMPHVFRSQAEFKHWFANPLTAIVEQGDEHRAAVERLHAVMRPFILRRLKVDVAKQLPCKVEHVVTVPLARRQRFLYEDFISRASTREALTGGGYMGMMSVLMKLRMVCNHPDLFEPRPIATPFACEPVDVQLPRIVFATFARPATVAPLPELCLGPASGALAFDDERALGIADRELDARTAPACCQACVVCDCAGVAGGASRRRLPAVTPEPPVLLTPVATTRWGKLVVPAQLVPRLQAIADAHGAERAAERQLAMRHHVAVAERKLPPVYGHELRRAVAALDTAPALTFLETPSLEERVDALRPVLDRFLGLYLPGAAAPSAVTRLRRIPYSVVDALSSTAAQSAFAQLPPAHKRRVEALHPVAVRQSVSFPDKMLVQYDCGKLQALASMLQRLKQGGHRVLIFTQMTRMLDILERFLNLHAYTYFRLDGATKVEDRQVMMERFNRDARTFVFILSTRSGGLGINLVGADTVVFYDSDWNPAMDAQAQDRAHRIGQTRDVHIYRLVSERTVEENIFLKSNQKRHLNRLSVEDGNFVAEALGIAGGTLPRDGDAATAMAAVEDEADTSAAARVAAEDNADDAPDGGVGVGGVGGVGGAAEDDKPVSEDADGNPLLSRAQFAELETQLRDVDRWAVAFRTGVLPVVDRLKETRALARMAELSAEEWRLDELARAKQETETEGEGALQEAFGALPPAASMAVYKASKRALKLESRVRYVLGLAWALKHEGGSKKKPFYINADTGEMSRERPRLLDAKEERKRTAQLRWGALPPAAMQRVAGFLGGGRARTQGVPQVCRAWARALQSTAECADWFVIPPRAAARTRVPWATIGSRVEARYLDGDAWYTGTVLDVDAADGALDVLYSDGDVERGVGAEKTRADAGVRVTIAREDAELVEVWNRTLASSFGCGAELSAPVYSVPAPVYRLDVELPPEAAAHAQPLDLAYVLGRATRGCIVVLGAGTHVLSDTALPESVLVVGEAQWATRCGRLALARARVLASDDRPLAAEAMQRDWPVLDAKRASVLRCAGSVAVHGRCDGVWLQVDEVALAAPGASLVRCAVDGAVAVRAPGVVLEACTVARRVEVAAGASVALVRCALDSVAAQEARLAV